MKKKVLILHNRTTLNHYKNFIKTKYDKIIVIDHLTAIDCYNLNIKFSYLKNLTNFKPLSFSTIKCFKYMYEVDLKLRKNLKLKNNFFFSNYAHLNRDFSLLMFYEKLIANIIKLNSKNDIYYFDHKSNDCFDFFLNTINLYKYKNLHSIKIKPKNQINYELTKLFPKKDEDDLNLIKKYFLKIQEYKSFKKNNILTLNLEKKYVKLIKNNRAKLNCNVLNFDLYFSKKRFDVDIKFDEIIPKGLSKNKIFYKLLKKYLKYIWPFISNKVLSVHKTIEILYEKYKFKAFVTSHPTLKSSTIINYLNQKKVPSFCMLHGGTVGHFKNYIFWPRLHGSSIHHDNKLYFQFYSEQQKKNGY